MITPPTTPEDFERDYAERSGMSVAELRAAGQIVLPCDCGEKECLGWQMVSETKRSTTDGRFNG